MRRVRHSAGPATTKEAGQHEQNQDEGDERERAGPHAQRHRLGPEDGSDSAALWRDAWAGLDLAHALTPIKLTQPGASATDEVFRALAGGQSRAYDIIVAEADAVAKETGTKIAYDVGTMIELPRAALRAEDIARGDKGADFFSFGTNDLTQTALGLSRDDSAPILSSYLGLEIIAVDPFVSIDQSGVGELVRIGTTRGRAAKPGLKVGICGEHGGDPKSIAFFENAGLDYVSCSPFRVPVARLAAAQAALRGRAPKSEA